MNWFKENKFLTGGLVAGGLGAAVLSYFLWAAYDRYTEALGDFQGKSAELARLRALAPFPDRKNLDAMEAQRAEFQESIDKLHSTIHAAQFPLLPMSEVEFQDRLKASVVRISEAARKAGMALPEKFYMGFDQYQTEPPRKEAAPLLGRQLKAIEWVVEQLISQRVKSLDRLERLALPEEEGKGTGKGAKAGDKTEKPQKSDKVEKADAGGKEEGGLIRRETIEVYFRSEQPAFREVLNQIACSSKQFYVVTQLEVKNEKEKGPPRAEPPVEGEAGAGDSGESAAGAVLGSAPKSGKAVKARSGDQEWRPIVGDELIEVSLRLDAVHLEEGKHPQGGAATKGGTGK